MNHYPIRIFVAIFIMFVLINISLNFGGTENFQVTYEASGDSVLNKLSTGQSEMTLTFGSSGGTNSNANLNIPKRCEVLSASFNVTGLAYNQDEYPTNVLIDVGDDGDSDWEFNLSGAGSLGKQNVFVGDILNRQWEFNQGDFDDTLTIRLPKTAKVLSASMDVVGYSHGVPNGNFSTTTMDRWTTLTNQYSDTVVVKSARGGNNPGSGWGASGHYLMLRSNPYNSNDIDCNIVVESDSFPRFNTNYITMDWDVVEHDNFNLYIRIEDENNNFVTAKSYGGDNNVHHSDTQTKQVINVQSLPGNYLNMRLRLWDGDAIDIFYSDYGRIAVDGIYISDSGGNPLPDFPKNVSVDVGADGNRELLADYLTGSQTIPGFVNTLNNLIDNPSAACQITVDKYGNEYLDIPIKVSILSSPGIVNLTNLDIEYEYDARVYKSPHGFLRDELNSLIPSSGSGDVSIPISVSSTTGGKLKISGIDIKYNAVPTTTEIDAIEIDEDSLNPKIIDLNDYFSDDSSAPLEYVVALNSAPDKIEAYVEDDHYLTINANLEQDWYGDLTILVRATDSGDLSTESNLIDINVLAVNDEPRPKVRISGISLWEDGGGTKIALDEISYFVDPEGDTLYYSVSVDPEGVTPDAESNIFASLDDNNNLIIKPADDWFGYNVPIWVYCDDDDSPIDTELGSPHQSFIIDIMPINDPPEIIAPETLFMEEDVNVDNWLNLLDITSDVESSDDKLRFKILSNDNEDNILVTIDKQLNLDVSIQKEDYVGSAKVKLQASDEQGLSSETSFKIQINPVNDGPRILKLPPGLVIYEDYTDDTSLNIFDIFYDPDSPNTYSVAGQTYIGVSVSQDDGKIIFTPEPNWFGSEKIILNAIDSYVESDNSQKYAQVELNVSVIPVNDPPRAPKIISPQEPRANTASHEIDFEAEDAVDVDSSDLTYYWDFDDRIDSDSDGDPTNDIDSVGQKVTYKYPTSGYYFVTLTVSDGELNSTPTTGVFVKVTTNFDKVSKKIAEEPSTIMTDILLSIPLIIIIIAIIMMILIMKRRYDREREEELKEQKEIEIREKPPVMEGELVSETRPHPGPASTVPPTTPLPSSEPDLPSLPPAEGSIPEPAPQTQKGNQIPAAPQPIQQTPTPVTAPVQTPQPESASQTQADSQTQQDSFSAKNPNNKTQISK